MKKLPYEPISIRPPKGEAPPVIPSLYPLIKMVERFIKEVPVDKIHDENIRKEWMDYKNCTGQAFDSLLDCVPKIFMPYPDLDGRIQCLDQRIEGLIIKAPIDQVRKK